MNKTTLGLIFAISFVVLEATQFVYFGGLFQKINPLLFGFLVLSLTMIIFIGWTLLINPGQIKIALTMKQTLLTVNLGAVMTFTASLLAVRLIEPAITYTISAGTMPITAYVLYRLGLREGEDMRNKAESMGNILIFCSIIFLAIITIMGHSGFVRGDDSMALLGVVLSILDGVFFTLILVYSQRLNVGGVGAAAVMGLRLPLYVLVTGMVVYSGYGNIDAISSTASPGIGKMALYVTIGFLLLAPPLYFLQKAVTMLPTLTISALTAMGPFFIFLLQIIEGRIDYSTITVVGLTIYVTGAMFSSAGAVKAETQPL